MAVTEFTTAPAGTGKSLIRCARFLADDFFIHTDMHLWTNYPINVPNMAQFVADHSPLTVEDVIARIHFIPAATLDEWRKGKSSPLTFFKEINLDGCRIAIDEIHNFIGTASPKQIAQEWKEFLGEIRHRGCEFEGISQSESKVNKVVRDEAGLKRRLFNDENKPDPFFFINMHDWYQLKAAFFTGLYVPTIWQQDYTEVHGKWAVTTVKTFTLDPQYFPLYDSYSAPHSGGNKSEGKKHPFETKTKVQLILWFLVRNASALLFRLGVFVFVIWLTFFGGGNFCIKHFMGLLRSTTHTTVEASASTLEPAPLAVAPADSASATLGKVLPSLEEAHAQVEALKSDLAALKTVNTDLTVKNDVLTKEIARHSSVVMLGKDSITFKSGLSVQVGDLIPFGIYKGKTLKGINHAKRFAWLDDDSVLYLML